ncbi:ABC transporter ATP-binding protein [Buchananella hordeovulneris]|uniref:ABC transporter ATP-binding protein/permease n=1 Tax=Buchananella hordeovulneris TaxID=52770 RepID=UPI000F5E9259|nr:ABC transporter ATP-binding protein [Buchananella hordeovulneris]RRD49654.1 ABC transporter ATP-binding protein [Buchananella hordeovulneris]
MHKWAIIALAWLSSAALAALYLLLGRGVDQLAAGTTPTITPTALAALSVSALAAWAASFLGGRLLPRVERTERHRLLDHVFALGVAERTQERTGRIVNTATDGVERVATYRALFLGPMLASLATPALILVIVAIALDPVAAGLLAISIPLVPLTVGLFQLAFKSVSRRYRAASRALAAQELDAIQGLSALVLMNAGQAMARQLAQATEDVRRRVMRYLAGNQIVLLVVDSVFSLGMITGAVVLALTRHAAGALTGGQALALVLLSTIMLDPLDRIGQFFYLGMGGMAAAREIKRFTAQVPAVIEAPDATVPTTLPAPGELEVRDAHFAYDPATPVLRGASLRVAPGENVVLTGPSGGGKSTLAALVQATARPAQGTVSLDGVDLATAPLAWIRSRLAVVEQTTYLFSGTLRDNLLLAKPTATDDKLLAALHAAHLGELLARLPAGLDTEVGQRATALSGGEAQRVAIARAILKDAPFLLLDEPTAHVDLAAEAEILAALRALGRDRTTLTISHRHATIADADRRLALVEGTVR